MKTAGVPPRKRKLFGWIHVAERVWFCWFFHRTSAAATGLDESLFAILAGPIAAVGASVCLVDLFPVYIFPGPVLF